MSTAVLASLDYARTPTEQCPKIGLVAPPPEPEHILQWDATRDLAGYDILAHRQLFPRYRGTPAALSPLPDAGTWAANLAVGIMEILCHYRPPSQLQRWVLPQLYATIEDMTKVVPLKRDTRGHIFASHYHACSISERIAETCVIVQVGHRKHSASIRLEGLHGRWIATAIEIL